jgi:glycerol uptake facilitator-like aquaporin
LAYIFIQILASIAATLTLIVIFPYYDPAEKMSIAPKLVAVDINSEATYFQAFMMEVVLTFILVYVIFSTAFSKMDTKFEVKEGVMQKKTVGRYLTVYARVIFSLAS